jgi:GTP pyrophosphokinase
LYYFFGKGYLQPDEIKKFKNEREATINRQKKIIGDEKLPTDAKSFEKALKKSQGQDTILIGDDMQKIDFTLAPCCNPIPGDDVFGFLTVTEGIKIHRNACPNAQQLLSSYGNRVIKARWSSQLAQSYLVSINLSGIDRVGMIQDISRIISAELHINMRGLQVETFEGIFEGTIKVYVNDTKHLDTLMSKLSSIEGIDSVSRIQSEE